MTPEELDTHTPGPMRPVTAAEVAATAVIRFREQYRDWGPDNRFSDGKSKADVDHVFDTQAHTPENVAAILNKGWAYPQCRSCQRYVCEAVQMTEEWGDDTWTLCLQCIEHAANILRRGAKRAALKANQGGE